MKKIRIITGMAIMLFLFYACQKDEPKRPSSDEYTITSPKDQDSIAWGEMVLIIVGTKGSDWMITHCNIYVDGKQEISSDSYPWVWQLWTDRMGEGEHRIKAEIELDEQYILSDSVTVTIVKPIEFITTPATEITDHSAVVGGSIDLHGHELDVISKFVCYSSVTDEPVFPQEGVSVKGLYEPNTDSYSLTLDELEPETTYYYRMYVTNRDGLHYGNVLSFTTGSEGGTGTGGDPQSDLYPTGTFTDARDGTIYNWVMIDSVTWMAENLKYLPEAPNPSFSENDVPSYFVYGYSDGNLDEAKATENYQTYGVLYNWPAAFGSCPSGWHLATDDEFDALEDHLRDVGFNHPDATSGFTYTGALLREGGTTHWNELPDGNRKLTNYTKFTALPGGYCSGGKSFDEIGNYAYFWVDDEITDIYAGYHVIYADGTINESSSKKYYGMSVRCVKDDD